MCPGEIIIHNDVIGVITDVDGRKCTVKNKEDKIFIFDISDCTSVIKPAALALLIYNKVLKKVKE